jgi:hypothetical protein
VTALQEAQDRNVACVCADFEEAPRAVEHSSGGDAFVLTPGCCHLQVCWVCLSVAAAAPYITRSSHALASLVSTTAGGRQRWKRRAVIGTCRSCVAAATA